MSDTRLFSFPNKHFIALGPACNELGWNEHISLHQNYPTYTEFLLNKKAFQ